MLGGIEVQHAAAEHGNGTATRLQSSAVGRRINAARQAADDRQAGPRQTAREPLGLPQTITGGVPRAHDRQRQLILRCTVAAPEQNPRRIGYLTQQGRITRVGFRYQVDLMRAAQLNLPVNVQLARPPDTVAQPGPDAGHLPQLFSRGGQRRAVRAEPTQQRPPRPRADTRNQTQTQRIAQLTGIPGREEGQRVHGGFQLPARGLQVLSCPSPRPHTPRGTRHRTRQPAREQSLLRKQLF